MRNGDLPRRRPHCTHLSLCALAPRVGRLESEAADQEQTLELIHEMSAPGMQSAALDCFKSVVTAPETLSDEEVRRLISEWSATDAFCCFADGTEVRFASVARWMAEQVTAKKDL